MLNHRTKLLATAGTVISLGWPVYVQATVIVTDPNLTNVENALSSAPLGMYSYGTWTAWSADGGNGNGGCSGSSGNPFQTSSSGGCTSKSFGIVSSSASASASLGTGKLSAGASTGPITAMGAAAGALMWDTLTFSGASPGAMGTLSLPVTGTFFNGGVGAAGLAVNPSSNWIYNWTQLDSSNSSPTLTLSFSIVNGTPTELAAGLGADVVWNGNLVSSTVDPPWTLTLPNGVTYTTTSGDPLLPASVPEPGTFSLMGLAMMASASVWARGRRGRQ